MVLGLLNLKLKLSLSLLQPHDVYVACARQRANSAPHVVPHISYDAMTTALAVKVMTALSTLSTLSPSLFMLSIFVLVALAYRKVAYQSHNIVIVHSLRHLDRLVPFALAMLTREVESRLQQLDPSSAKLPQNGFHHFFMPSPATTKSERRSPGFPARSIQHLDKMRGTASVSARRRRDRAH